MPAPDEVFTTTPPPRRTICAISCFMHTKVPRRLMSRMRSHSSSSISCSGCALFSTPALLKAMSSRPNRSTTCATAASTCSGIETSHAITSTSPPACFRAASVSLRATAVRSRMATRAPSAAKASAVARPMPLAAPVTRATLPVKRSGLAMITLLSDPVVLRPSRPHQDLQRLAIVHGAVAVGYAVEIDRAVEHAARVDAAVHDVRQQFVNVRAHRRRAACDDDVAVKHGLRARDGVVMGHAHAADRAAGADDAHRGDHRLSRADAFEHGLDTKAPGQGTHAFHRLIPALAYDVRRAERPRELDPRLVAAHNDDLLGA